MNNNSNNNSSRGTTPGSEPPRPQLKYNLAALRLAQSSNNNQDSQIHIVSDAPSASMASSVFISPAASAHVVASSTPSNASPYAAIVRGAGAPRGAGSSIVASPANAATAALLTALHIGGDDRPVPASANNTPSAPVAPTAKYTASTTAVPPSLPQQQPPWAAPTAAGLGMASFVKTASNTPPAPRSFPLQQQQATATVLAGPQRATLPLGGAQLPGPAPFTTAVPFPIKAAPATPSAAGNGVAAQLVGLSDGDPSRRSVMAMAPMSGAMSQAPQLSFGPAEPTPPAPQLPQSRGVANATYVKPFQQKLPMPAQPQPQPQLPSPNPAGSRSVPSGQSTPPQPGRPCLFPQQPQQPQLPLQFQQQQWQPKMQILQHQQVPFQAKPPAPNSLVPAPRTQRDGRANVISVADNCPSPATAAATHMQPPPTQLNAQMPLPSSSSSSGHQPPLGVASLPLSPPQQQQQQQQQQLPFPLPQPMSKGGLPLRPEMSLPAVAQPAGSMNPAAPVAGNAPNVVNRCNTAGPTTAVAAAPSSGAASASKPTSASCGSPSPPTASLPAMAANAASAAATAASSATVAGGPIMDIQQVLQRMGISAHMASTPPSTTSAAAAAVAAAAAAVPSTNTAATSAQLSQLMQRQERQQQQQAPLNFYSTPAGAAASAFQQPLYPPQYQQQQRRRQQEPRFQPRHGRDGSNGGGGGNAGGNHQRYFDPSHQQRQQQHGRGAPALPRSVQNARAAQHPSPDAPVSHFAAPDPETLKRFKNEYAQQEDAESVSDELKAQQATKVGTVGTLDEEVCLSLIESHDVIFVVTDTGTGKSTRIPIALHKAYPDALIVNAQPRRTAAINLAQRVAEVLDEKLGEEVGYSVRGEHIGDLGNTKVMYVTTYSLFVFFLWHELKEKLPFTYIIVDEFHERTPDVEVILLMLKLWLKKHPKAFKLILCSATAQMEEWQNFFDGLSVGTYFRSPIMYPVREYFIEDLQKLLGFRAAPISPQDSNNMVTSQQMHQLILVCKQLLEYLAKNTATQDSVLVFMPGRTQVELMTTWMRDNLEESVEPVAWYRDVDLSVIQEALARSAVTRKKVYVATDIAEVSLTLPDVVFVIDSGTGKRPQVSEKEQTSYAFPPLRLLWETASNAQQRRGRVGRVQQGFYFSLLSHEHHKTLRETENRIKNAVLTELVLHSLLITQRPFAFFQLCNERPEKGALSYSLHLLQDGGLIIGKDDALAEAERVALDRSRTSYVIDSPWNALIEEALTETQPTTAATEETQPNLAVSASASAADMRAKEQDATAQPRPSGEESNSDAEGSDDDDDDDVRIPEAEGSAFQQRYYMTLRGVIAARSPVSVAAATNIFYGLLCGTPTLSMLAAAIESSKSPFHVPYTINDRVERAGMVRAVSQVMQRYHGSLQSDLICAMEVVLEYMSMQRDGLSEEAQEEWCQDRSISRTRVVDTLNLFAQMKEQVSSVLPFPDVTDIDVLTAQFNQNAELLVLMLVASHTELAIQVQLDGPVAQKKGFVGHGVFFPLKCLKDESVPTVCPWERTKISVPLSLQTIQRKVLAVFSSQVEPDLFALVVLVFSFKLRYTVLESDTVPSYLMSVSHSGVRRTFRCDVLTAQQILQLRRIQCAQLRCMQLQVEERVNANESEKLSAALKSANSDFGLPASAVETPYLIPTVLQHGLKLLVSRLRGSPSFSAPKQPITDFPAGTAYCKLQHTAELSPPILQSVLVHSNNGLSIVQPVVSPLSAKSAAEGNGQAAAGASPSATTADAEAVKAETEAASQYDAEADDDTSEKSSETGSEEHVATFRYDL